MWNTRSATCDAEMPRPCNKFRTLILKKINIRTQYCDSNLPGFSCQWCTKYHKTCYQPNSLHKNESNIYAFTHICDLLNLSAYFNKFIDSVYILIQLLPCFPLHHFQHSSEFFKHLHLQIRLKNDTKHSCSTHVHLSSHPLKYLVITF